MSKFKLAIQRLKGKIALLQNDPELAAHYFEIALSSDPDNIKLINDLQIVYKLIPNWERFFELYQDALTKWPEKTYVRANIGISYMHLTQYEKATPYLEDYIQSQIKSGNHFSPNIYSKLGICYAYLGNWDSAETAFAKADEESPWDVDMIFGRICVLYGTGRSHEILEYLETKIARYPKMYPLLFWKADFTRYILHQPESSIEFYQSALKNIIFFSFKLKYEPYYFVVQNYCDLATVVDEY
jgi:tetratricopeptide (TPR) repeat protein